MCLGAKGIKVEGVRKQTYRVGTQLIAVITTPSERTPLTVPALKRGSRLLLTTGKMVAQSQR